jgi:hypothetical protein
MSNLNVQFSERQTVALEKLAEELETTKAGVLKVALSLLAVALREHKEGNHIGIVKDHVEIKEIIGIF